jgi:hypothetical protein
MTLGAVARQYVEGQRQMARLHHSGEILEAAQAVTSDLPSEPLTFVATSVEGTALAAVCAALHGHASDWQRLLLTTQAIDTAHTPIVVEPVDGGRGWRAALLRRYPDARFIELVPTPALSAA